MTMSNDAFEDWLTSMIAEMLADKICTLIIKGSGADEATGVEKLILGEIQTLLLLPLLLH